MLNKEKKTRNKSKAIALLLSIVMVFSGLLPGLGLTQTAYAAEHNGTQYGIDWRIDENGVLILGNDNTQQKLFASNTSGWADNTGENTWNWHAYKDEITAVKIAAPGIEATGAINRMFQDLGNLDYIDLTGFDTSGVTQMRALFRDTSAVHLNLRDCDFSKVGSIGSNWNAATTNMFLNSQFKIMDLPSYTVDPNNKNKPGNLNFLSGSGIAGSNTKRWFKIDGEDADTDYLNSGVKTYSTLNIAEKNGSDLEGTWVVGSEIQIIKQDEKGYGLAEAEFDLEDTGKYETNGRFESTGFPQKYYVPIESSLEIKETKVPAGYDPAMVGTTTTVTTDENGQAVGYEDNKILLTNYPLGDITVTKVWDDPNNEGVKSDVELTIDNGLSGEKAKSYSTEDTGKDYTGEWKKDGDKWTYTFKNLPLYNTETGKKLTYTVKEKNAPDGFVSSVDGLTVTNTIKSKKQNITVIKTWNDAGHESDRPSSLRLTLHGDGKNYTSDQYATAENGEENPVKDGDTWTYTFKNIPVYNKSDKEIRYTLSENAPIHYSDNIKGFRVVNNHEDVDPITPPVIKEDGKKTKYEQQSTYDRDGGDSETSESITKKMFDFVVDNYDTENYDYFIPTKDAVWKTVGNDNKAKADIIMSYKENIRDIYFFGSLCSGHGLTTNDIIDQIEGAAEQGRVHYFLEGIDYLPAAEVTVDGTKYKAAYKSNNSEIETSKDKSHHVYGTVDRYGSVDGEDKEEIEGHLESDVMGQHATIRQFAVDIVRELGSLRPEGKPSQIILSFDYWAWAACAASLEGDMEGDIALMREAASILKEYYEEGKVVWLMSNDSKSGANGAMGNDNDGYKAKISTDFGSVTNLLSSTTRAHYTYYLYPDSAQDFMEDPEAIPMDRLWPDLTNAGEFNSYIVEAYTRIPKKYTPSYEWATGALRTWLDDNDRPVSNWNSFRQNQGVIKYYTLSKRMAFYQFALLNPDMFLEVTAGEVEDWNIPHIDDWMLATYNGQEWRDYVPTYVYESAQAAQFLSDNNKQYNRYTITDTLNDGLVVERSNEPVEFYYYDGPVDESDLVGIEDPDEYKAMQAKIKEEYAKDANWKKLNKDQEYELKISDDRKTITIKTTGEGNSLDACNKRIKLIVHTDCKEKESDTKYSSLYVDNNPENSPRATNNDDSGKLTFITTHEEEGKDTINVSKTTVDSPILRKSFPRTVITATKEWKDDKGETVTASWPGNIIVHVSKVGSDEDVLPPQKLTDFGQTVTWGNMEEYTDSDGHKQTASGNYLQRYPDNIVNPNNEIEYYVWEEFEDEDLAKKYNTKTALVSHSVAQKANNKEEFETEGYKLTNEEKPKLKLTKIWKNDSETDRPDSLDTKLIIESKKVYDALKISTVPKAGDNTSDGTLTIENTYKSPVESWILKDADGNPLTTSGGLNTIAVGASTEITLINSDEDKEKGFEFAGCTLEVRFEDGESLSYVLQRGKSDNQDVKLINSEDTEKNPIDLTTKAGDWDKTTKKDDNQWIFEKTLDNQDFIKLLGYEVVPNGYEMQDKGSEDDPVTFSYQESGTDKGYYTAELTNEYDPKKADLIVKKTWKDTDGDFFDENGMPADNYTRPDVKVKVKGVYDDNGTEKEYYKEKEITLRGETKEDITTWTNDELKDLPVFAPGGKLIKYVVTEEVPDRYTAKENPITITPKPEDDGGIYTLSDAEFENTPITKEAYNNLTLTIKKVDGSTQTDKGLTGAVFTISSDVLAADVDETTGQDGTIDYTFSKPGTYKIVEKTAPAGYQKSETEYTVEVKKGEIVRVTEEEDADATPKKWYEKLYNLIFGDDTKKDVLESDGKTLKVGDEPLKANVLVKKEWEDNNDQDGLRDGSMKVKLQKKIGTGGWEDVATSDATQTTVPDENGDVVTNSGDEWTWEDLPAYKDGQEITYRVQEINLITGYEASYSLDDFVLHKTDSGAVVGDNQTVTVTNSHTPIKAKIAVKKHWDDDENVLEERKATTVKLEKSVDNGDTWNETGKTAVVETKDDSDETFALDTSQWGELPVYEGGKLIQYRIVENDTASDDLATAGYDISYSGGNVDDNVITLLDEDADPIKGKDETITVENSLATFKSTVTVTKKWEDNNNQDGIRPDAVDDIAAMFTLYQKYDGTDSAVSNPPTPEVTKNNDGSFTIKWSDLRQMKSKKEIQYYVKEEDPIAGYTPVGGDTPDMDKDNTGDEWKTQGTNWNTELTNKHEPEVTDLVINKTWTDGEYYNDETTFDAKKDAGYVRPALTFNITAVDEGETDVTSMIPAEKRRITIDGDQTGTNTWAETVSELPVYANGGKKITYTVTEVQPEGFKFGGNPATATPEKDGTTGVWSATANISNTPEKIDDFDPLELTIKKEDGSTSTDAGLAGAEFKFYTNNTYSTELTGANAPTISGATAANGKATASFKVPGTYYLKETVAPTGYQLSGDNKFEIVVDKNLESISLVAGGDDTTGNKVWKWLWNLIFGSDTKNTLEGNDSDGYTLVVQDDPKTAKISVNKKWEDADDQDGLRAKADSAGTLPKVTLEKSTDGDTWTDVDAAGVTVPNEDGLVKTEDNAYTWSDLPAYEDGKKLIYRVKETGKIAGYDDPDFDDATDGKQTAATFTLYDDSADAAKEGEATVTNSYDPETVYVKVTKAWNDDTFEGTDDYARVDVTFNISASIGTVDQASKKVKTDDNDQFAQWSKLPKYANKGTLIDYSVNETAITGWSASVGTMTAVDENGEETSTEADLVGYETTITNTPDPGKEVGTLTLNFVKKDSASRGTIPGAKFTIKKNGEDSGEETSATDNNGKTSYTFTEAGTYTITETTVPKGYSISGPASYTAVVDEDLDHIELKESKWTKIYNLIFGNGNAPEIVTTGQGDDAVHTLTVNNDPIKAELSVKKLWDDEKNEDGLREATTVKLWKKVGNDGEWADTGKTVDVGTTPASEGIAFDLNASWNDLVAYENGKVVYYKVEEDTTALEAKDYSTTYTVGSAAMSETDGVDLLDTTDTQREDKEVLVTNSYTRQKAKIVVNKVWNDNDDNSLRTDLTFKLSAKVGDDDIDLKYVAGTDKDSAVGDKTLTNKADGSVEWDNLPVLQGGQKITYTLVEEGANSAYKISYSPNPTTLDKDGTTTIQVDNSLAEPEERTVTRKITYKYIDENGNEAVGEKEQTVTITRTPKRVDPATGKVLEWNDWTASTNFEKVTSPTYDSSDDGTKQLKGWKPDKDAEKITADEIADIINNQDLTDYEDLSDEEKDNFWKQVSEDNFTSEVYYDPAEPPTGEGKTTRGLYDVDGNVQSHTWTPSDAFKNQINDYAVLPDGKGTPNSIPETGAYTLLDPDGNEVQELKTEQGTYTIDPNSGEVTFKPAGGFTGTADGVTIRVKDKLSEITGEYPTATYTPTVIANKETGTAKQDIIYTYLKADGTEAAETKTREATWNRFGTVDEDPYSPTFGEVSYDTPWKPDTDGDKQLAEANSPTVKDGEWIPNKDKVDALTIDPNRDKNVTWDEASKTWTYSDVHVVYRPKKASDTELTSKDAKYEANGSDKITQEREVDLTDKLETKTLPNGDTNEITGYTLYDPDGNAVPSGKFTSDQGTYELVKDADGKVTVKFTPSDNFIGTADPVTIHSKDKLSEELDKVISDLKDQANKLQAEIDTLDPSDTDYDAKKKDLADKKQEIDDLIKEYEAYVPPIATYTPTVVNNIETGTATRTVTYTYWTEDGKQASKTVTQTLMFTRVGTYDPSTDKVTYPNKWTPVDGNTFPAVDVPTIDGWIPNISSVPSLTISGPEDSQTIHVVYKQKTHWVTYIDPDGTVYKEKTNYKDKDTEIPAPKPTKKGYKFIGWDRSEDENGNVTYVAKWKKLKAPAEVEKPTKKVTPGGSPTVTGDNTNITMWVVLIVLALAAIVGLPILNRRKPRD